jgi:release factor glutamine methyltransferase
MKLGEAVQAAAARLSQAGIDDARREARALAAHVLGAPPGQILDQGTDIDEAALQELISRRAVREPLAFITGQRGFWTLELAVSPDTLIPRADSESLIEAALMVFPDRQAVARILDLGTGTGCLLLAALAEFPAAYGVGVDLSWRAAALAGRNATRNGLAARSGFVAGNWAASVSGRYDLILCNPPYITSAEIGSLMPEVAAYEPVRALDGGSDGFRAYAQLMPVLHQTLAPGGVAILELGFGQLEGVLALAEAASLRYVATRDDLAGIPRALVLCACDDAQARAKKLFGSTPVGS